MSRMQPLHELRMSLDLTQEQIADELGVTQPFISQVENGESRLGTDNAFAVRDLWGERLARLGITLEDLLSGKRKRSAA